MTFKDNGDGTGTISGTPANGSQGTYPVTLSATNSSGSTATLALTITVNAAARPHHHQRVHGRLHAEPGGRGRGHHDRLADAEDHRDAGRCPPG